ncbi:hypothetical protein [Nocardia carnea]|uniref:hypothetical protein n=1 Tax=Nocardia carnea TaxID=37328 RepID=UPI0024560E4E|nr:hypothetical protein [Nocardia carnea]
MNIPISAIYPETDALRSWALDWVVTIAEVLAAAGEPIPDEWGCPSYRTPLNFAGDRCANADDPWISAIADIYAADGPDELRRTATELHRFAMKGGTDE